MENRENQQTNIEKIAYDNFDDLDGLEFENWCANLLRNNGFVNVEVTRASGDQGVDVLAEKGETVYAALLGSCDLAQELSQEDLIAMFRFIYMDWNWGET